jgi:5-hydroxyisourate hydrolase-like protein (transthyretin family)
LRTGPTDLVYYARFRRRSRTLLSLACILLCADAWLRLTITGTVTDRTTGKPSSGDTIAVINTAQSMDEITKVTSDAQGRFQRQSRRTAVRFCSTSRTSGAEYFKSVPPGTSSVEIDVYDSAAKIDGITGEALVLRAETDTGGKTAEHCGELLRAEHPRRRAPNTAATPSTSTCRRAQS